MRRFRSNSDSVQADLEELNDLKAKQRELDAKIQRVSAEPERIKREEEEQATTLPAPDDIAERIRRKQFEDKASRVEIRNVRRTQGRSLLLLLLLLTATALLASWVVKLFQG